MSKEIIDFLRQVTPGYNIGWGGPEYSGWQDEQMSWKTTCYVGDWSFLVDVQIEGPDALKLFEDSCVNSFAKFDIGQAKHIIQCNSAGKVIAEGVLMRMSQNTFRTQSSPVFWSTFLLSKGGYDARWKSLSTFQFQVSGPNALAVCEELAGEALADVRFMHFREIKIAGERVYALRQGMAGEIGFELHGDSTAAPAVYAEILRVGEKHGIRRLGRRTAMINHLEAAFPTGFWHYIKDLFTAEVEGYGEHIQRNFDLGGGLVPALTGSFEGQDIRDYLFSPYELGWGKSVKFDHEFTGRKALEQEAAHPRRNRVTLEFNSEDMIAIYASLFQEGEPYDFMDIPHQQRWVAWADAVVKDGRVIGISSVPGYSYFFRKILALAFIDVAFVTPGTEVTIVWGRPGTPQKNVRATVCPAPYKADKRRTELGKPTPATA